MSNQDGVFTLEKLKGSNFPVTVQARMEEYLYKRQDAPFSIGDVVIYFGINDAWDCIRHIPKQLTKKLYRRVVLPILYRNNKLLEDPKIISCLEILEMYTGEEKISFSDLDTKADLLWEETDKGIDYSSVYFLSKAICGDEKIALDRIVNAVLFMSNVYGSSEEFLAQKKDLLLMFPPVVKKYHEYTDAFRENAVIKTKKNWLTKFLKFKRKDGKSFEFEWGNFKPEWGIKFEVVEFDGGCEYDTTWFIAFKFLYGRFLINLPKWLPRHYFNIDHQFNTRTWGFEYMDDHYLRIGFGRWYKYIKLPWCLEHFRTENLMTDGTWKSSPKWNDPERETHENNIAQETHSFKYVLRSGVVQHRLATVKVTEREWRRYWLKSIPIFNKIRRDIEVEFNDEVGERTGSWKGGVIGCGEEMLPNETPFCALLRMEEKRKFE